MYSVFVWLFHLAYLFCDSSMSCIFVPLAAEWCSTAGMFSCLTHLPVDGFWICCQYSYTVRIGKGQLGNPPALWFVQGSGSQHAEDSRGGCLESVRTCLSHRLVFSKLSSTGSGFGVLNVWRLFSLLGDSPSILAFERLWGVLQWGKSSVWWANLAVQPPAPPVLGWWWVSRGGGLMVWPWAALLSADETQGPLRLTAQRPETSPSRSQVFTIDLWCFRL